MKNLLTGGISALLLSGLIVPATQAQMPMQQMPMQQMRQPTLGQMTPRGTGAMEMPRIKASNLAYLAYWGYFENAGIPSFLVLQQNYKAGNVTAMDIAEAASDEGRLGMNALEDDGYLSALERELDFILGPLGNS